MSESKVYPVWTNILYFIASCYSLYISRTFKDNRYYYYAFLIYALLLLLTGIFSIIYHVNTFSFTLSSHNETDTWSMLDQSFAILTVVYPILLFFLVVYLKKRTHVDENFFLTIVFIILSIVFYVLSSHSLEELHRHDCTMTPRKAKCTEELYKYDIFHSNWHIFSAMAIIFWLGYIKFLINK